MACWAKIYLEESHGMGYTPAIKMGLGELKTNLSSLAGIYVLSKTFILRLPGKKHFLILNLQQTASSQEVGIHCCATVACRLLYSAIPSASDSIRLHIRFREDLMLLLMTASPDDLIESGLFVAEWLLIFDLLHASLNIWLSSCTACVGCLLNLGPYHCVAGLCFRPYFVSFASQY